MLKPLHSGHHNIFSLVICFKGVKSILVLCKLETEVYVGTPLRKQCLHSCWVIPSGPGEWSPPAKQDFCQRMLPSYSELHCPVLGGSATKERISKKTWILIYHIHEQIKALSACCCPQHTQPQCGEAALGAGSYPDFSVLRWSWKALGSRALLPKNGRLCSGAG